MKPFLLWESKKYYTFWACVCSLSCPACNALAPYSDMWPCLALPYFSTISLKRHDWREKVIEHKMCVLIFFTNFVCKVPHSKKNWSRYDWKCILVTMWSARYSCQILMEVDFLDRFSQKYGKYQIPRKCVQWEPNCSMRADRGTDVTKLNVAFRTSANAPKNLKKIVLLTQIIEPTPTTADMCRFLPQQKG